MTWLETKEIAEIYTEELDHLVEDYRVNNNMRQVPADHKTAVYIYFLLSKIDELTQECKRQRRELMHFDQIIKHKC